MLVRIGNQICRWDLTKGQMTVFGNEEVQKPGSRGGKWWLDDRGHVRYDERPKGKPKKQEVQKPKYPSIVQRAIDETVTDIGQLSAEDKKLLEQHVKSGILDKGKGGLFPTPKLVYAKKGFKFQEERDKEVKKLLAETKPKDAKKKETETQQSMSVNFEKIGNKWRITVSKDIANILPKWINHIIDETQGKSIHVIEGNISRTGLKTLDWFTKKGIRVDGLEKLKELFHPKQIDAVQKELPQYMYLFNSNSASQKKATIWQKAKQEAQQRINEIADQWRLKGAPDDIDAMREAIKEVAKKYGIPYDVLRKQALWEVKDKPEKRNRSTGGWKQVVEELKKMGIAPEQLRKESSAIDDYAKKIDSDEDENKLHDRAVNEILEGFRNKEEAIEHLKSGSESHYSGRGFEVTPEMTIQAIKERYGLTQEEIAGFKESWQEAKKPQPASEKKEAAKPEKRKKQPKYFEFNGFPVEAVRDSYGWNIYLKDTKISILPPSYPGGYSTKTLKGAKQVLDVMIEERFGGDVQRFKDRANEALKKWNEQNKVGKSVQYVVFNNQLVRFVKSQLGLFSTPGEKKEVQQPGSRGGIFYRTESGKVVYGQKPTPKPRKKKIEASGLLALFGSQPEKIKEHQKELQGKVEKETDPKKKVELIKQQAFTEMAEQNKKQLVNLQKEKSESAKVEDKQPWEMSNEEFYKNQIEIKKGKHSPYQVKDEYYIIVHKDKEKSGQPHTSSAWKLDSDLGETPEKLSDQTKDKINKIIQIVRQDASVKGKKAFEPELKITKINPPEFQKKEVPREKEPWEMTKDEFVKSPPSEADIFLVEGKEPLRGKIGSSPDFMGGKPDRGYRVANTITSFDVAHRNIVKQAIASGKEVPPEVLKDYPELQKKETESKIDFSKFKDEKFLQSVTKEQAIKLCDAFELPALKARVQDDRYTPRKAVEMIVAEMERIKTKKDEKPAEPKKEIEKPQTNKPTENKGSTETEFVASSSGINKEIAARSHQGTSFDPEKRGKQEISGFVEEVQSIYDNLKDKAKSDEQKKILVDEMKRFQSAYAQKTNEFLSAKGRIVSSMIAGPANFPVRQMEKRNRALDNKYAEISDWKKRAIASIDKKLKAQSTADAGGPVAEMKQKLDEAKTLQQRMKEINAAYRKNKLEDFGLTEHEKNEIKINMKIGLADQPYPQYKLTNNLANIKRMEQRFTELEKRETAETKESDFAGGKIVENADIDRLQIIFDQKPSPEVIAKLKSLAFKWSPSNGAWQRQLTANARYAVEQVKEMMKKVD